MEKKFLGLNFDFLDNIDIFENDCLYIFSNNNDEKILEKKITKENPFYNFKIISENEFWEKYLLSDKIISKEEKEVIFFYNSLNDDLKNKLGIKQYFDCIDIAYRYYNFMKEYLDYELENKLDQIEMYYWQKEKLDIYMKIHEKMLKISKDSEYIPKYLLPYYCEYNNSWVKKYRKIVFINKFSFSNLELKHLKNIKKIELLFNIYEQDYNKKELKLENITLKNFNNNKVKLIECSDKTTQLVKIIENENFNTIYDYEKNIDKKIKKENTFLSQNYVLNNISFNMNQTFNYLMVKDIYKVIENRKNKDYLISDLFTLFNNDDVIKLLNIDIKNKLMKLSKNNKYTNSIEIPEISFIDEIISYTKKEDFVEILEKIGLYRSVKDQYSNANYYFFEALTEINTIDFNFLEKDFVLNYLKIFLKYLDKKEINLNLKEKEKEIKDITKLDTFKKENLYLINLNGEIDLNYSKFFTNNQRKKLNLPILENKIYEKLFEIYINLEKADNIVLSYIKNADQKIFESSFLAKLIFEYNLKISKEKLSVLEKSEIIKGMYQEKKQIIQIEEDSKNILKDKEEKISNISVSNFLKLYKSEIQYYFETKIENLDIYDNSINALTIGLIVHRIMEKLFLKYKERIFDVNEHDVDSMINETLKEKSNAILFKYQNFFLNLVIFKLKNNILNFLKILKKELANKKIYDIFAEFPISKTLKISEEEVRINGRSDLVIITNEKIYIIDFKTGKYSKEKEKDYSLQMKLYSLMDEMKNYENKEIDCILSFLLSDEVYKKIDYTKDELDEEKIYDVISNYLNLEKEIYDIGKMKYSNLKGVLGYEK